MIVAEILQVYSNGGDGHKDYWRFCFPAYIIGSAAAIITFFASSINLITYTPPEYSGVAGAMVQTIAQLGGAIALAVQAGLQTKDVANWKQSGARSFWFMVAWVAVLSLQYVIFYRQPESQAREHELARQRMREANKDDAIYS